MNCDPSLLPPFCLPQQKKWLEVWVIHLPSFKFGNLYQPWLVLRGDLKARHCPHLVSLLIFLVVQPGSISGYLLVSKVYLEKSMAYKCKISMKSERSHQAGPSGKPGKKSMQSRGSGGRKFLLWGDFWDTQLLLPFYYQKRL